jgi:hypothetical protein
MKTLDTVVIGCGFPTWETLLRGITLQNTNNEVQILDNASVLCHAYITLLLIYSLLSFFMLSSLFHP